MARMVSPTSGKAISARSVSRVSCVSMTTRSATTVQTCRNAMTRTSDDRRASRLASTTMRDMRSAEWRPWKNASGMAWMCA